MSLESSQMELLSSLPQLELKEKMSAKQHKDSLGMFYLVHLWKLNSTILLSNLRICNQSESREEENLGYDLKWLFFKIVFAFKTTLSE